MSGPPATASRDPSWTTARRPSPSWPGGWGSPPRPYGVIWTLWWPTRSWRRGSSGCTGRGRASKPAKVFALTDCGRDAFDQSYDKLAADALAWIQERFGGDEAVVAFARARIAAQAEVYRKAVETAAPEERTEALAKALSADGYAATARSAPVGEQLCQHHCPVAHVAEKFPQLCDAETEIFSQLLGTHVQRLATIAHGDGVCTTFIPKISHMSHNASASTAGRNPA